MSADGHTAENDADAIRADALREAADSDSERVTSPGSTEEGGR